LILSYVCSGKRCPICAERVKAAALKCKHCGHEFNETGPANRQAYTRIWEKTQHGAAVHQNPSEFALGMQKKDFDF
jgi:hypothetical protein